MGALSDIARKQMEERIAELELENERLKQAAGHKGKPAQEYHVFDYAADGMIIYTEQREIIAVNSAMSRLLGTEKGQLEGSRLDDLVPGDYHFKLEKQKKLLQSQEKVKGVLPMAYDGSLAYFEFTTSRLPESSLLLSIFRDVTEKRRLEQKIRKHEDLYKDLFVEALDGIVYWRDKGTIINANQAACRIFESTHDELLARKVDEFVLHKDEGYFQILEELYKEGQVRNELFFLMPNGQKKLLEFTVKLNAVEGYHMTIFRNVSERYKMEEELRESERKFRSIFEGALEGLILWDENFTIVDINASGERMLQMPQHEIVGQSLLALLNDCNFTEEELRLHLEELSGCGQSNGTISYILKSGRKMHFEFSLKQNVFSGLSLTTFKDITEKLEMEEQLKKSDTLNVIGQLAAGIAHEIRNPMTALKGFIQLLEDSAGSGNSMYFNIITSELQRIDSIINEFLILAKPQAIQYVEKDIIQLMKETVEFLTAQAVLHNVQFRTDYDKNLPLVFCEPNQLKKVFINIIKNAIEVMPKGGIITICVQKTKTGSVRISIRDEGSGIPPEKLRKLGEPFYTTKERGTGLGLMVTYKIIEEHEGNIEVESKLGEGTVFHIDLPMKRGGYQDPGSIFTI
ncbi:PAS domain S-box protein [Bacillus infantis]|uniref:PAS domain S-box protein n=1 Tax=Bacillus infantis TaxID=324767 RepID=UPI002155C95D|nr:PAS domain S-box protein [Bacillus infantis]